jgi:2-polyprenyl-3-methyl-5-hydroxy-6-metoxy-1,4-benzoquinol methylase
VTEYDAEYYANRRMAKLDDRHAPRTIAKIRRVADFGTASRVLEIGCGLGTVTRHLASEVDRVTALDVSVIAIQTARHRCPARNVTFVGADALAWETAERFDLVLALAVFEHFEPAQRSRFLRNTAAWLAPGGRLVLHVPITRSWSASRRKSKLGMTALDYTGDPTHRSRFSPRSLRRILRADGFAVEREWLRFARWGLPAGWSAAALRAAPAAIREKFAMEMIVSAVPEGRA